MKRSLALFCSGLFFLSCSIFLHFALLASSGEAAEVVLTTGDWEPWVSEKAQGNGFFAEVVSAVFKEVQITPVYKFHPWKRTEKMVEDGESFAAFPYFKTEERTSKFDFSEPVAFSVGRFFYKKARFPKGISYNVFEDLKDYQVVGVLGYWYEKPFEAAKLKMHLVKEDKLSFAMLEKDRADLVPADELVGWSIIKEAYPGKVNDFATVDKPMNKGELRLMVSRKYPDAANVLKKFHEGLKKIKENGVYKSLLQKYGLRETE